jgi:hypothetical protein
MMHAVIRTDRDAFHFFGEVNAYNIQTLRYYVRWPAKDAGAVRLRLHVDAADRKALESYGLQWLSKLPGTVVEIRADSQ